MYTFIGLLNNPYLDITHIIIVIRVMCLAALEDYDSCIEVVSASISLHGQLPDLLIIRARINYMFGNVSGVTIVMVITGNP